MQSIKLGQLRAVKLPEETKDESDLLASLRKNVGSEHPDKLRITVPSAMMDLIKKLPRKDQAAKPAPAAAGKTGELEDDAGKADGDGAGKPQGNRRKK